MSNEQPQSIIPAGSIVYVNGGCSRDWHCLGLFRAVADIDVAAERAAFTETIPEDERDWRYVYQEDFLAWMVDTRGILVELQAVELEVGNHGPDTVKPYGGTDWKMMYEPVRHTTLEVQQRALVGEIAELERDLRVRRGLLAELETIQREREVRRDS